MLDAWCHAIYCHVAEFVAVLQLTVTVEVLHDYMSELDDNSIMTVPVCFAGVVTQNTSCGTRRTIPITML